MTYRGASTICYIRLTNNNGLVHGARAAPLLPVVCMLHDEETPRHDATDATAIMALMLLRLLLLLLMVVVHAADIWSSTLDGPGLRAGDFGALQYGRRGVCKFFGLRLGSILSSRCSHSKHRSVRFVGPAGAVVHKQYRFPSLACVSVFVRLNCMCWLRFGWCGFRGTG